MAHAGLDLQHHTHTAATTVTVARPVMTDDRPTCPHCHAALRRWRIPDGASWSEEHFYVCFNNDCPYYRDGWAWMRTQYSQQASYRYALNPATGRSLMIPVWSDDATREMIDDAEDGTA